MDGVKHQAQIDETIPVQLECLHGSSSRWRQACDASAAILPGKVLAPVLPAGMVERDMLARNGITVVGLRVLVIVTPLASQSQIIQSVGAMLAARFDVLDRKRLHGEACLAATILATAPSAFEYDLS